jgi:hypothetical protein
MPTTKHATMNTRIALLLFQHVPNGQRIKRSSESIVQSGKGKGLCFYIHESSPKRADAGAKVN